MGRRLVTIATAGALGVAGATGAVLVGAAAIPAAAEAVTNDDNVLADNVDRIRDALAGLVGDGTISEDQADAVAEELAGSGTMGHHGHRHPGPGGHGGFALGMDTASEALGLDRDELKDALHSGKTLADLAEEQGVEVDALVGDLVAAARERLAEAVAGGELTEDRAAELEAELQERIDALVEEGVPFGRHGGPGGQRDA